MFWASIAKLLRRFADAALAARLRGAEGDVVEARERERMANGRIALLESEVEFLVAWRDRELCRIRTEADILRARSVLQSEVSERE